jgi:hypothetical protein
MKAFCENQFCENPGAREVPVSVRKPSDQKRTFCVPCAEAYTIGCQHGTMGIGQMEFWVVAIADSGIVTYLRVHLEEKAAWQTVVGYLRENEGYRRPGSPEAVRDWLDGHEQLSVEVLCQKGLSDRMSFEDHRTLTRTDRYLTANRAILLVQHPSAQDAPFEARALEGDLDWGKIAAGCYGRGSTIRDALEALDLQFGIRKDSDDEADSI